MQESDVYVIIGRTMIMTALGAILTCSFATTITLIAIMFTTDNPSVRINIVAGVMGIITLLSAWKFFLAYKKQKRREDEQDKRDKVKDLEREV